MGLLVPASPSNTSLMRSTSSELRADAVSSNHAYPFGTTINGNATPHSLGTITELVTAANNTVESEWVRIWISGVSSSGAQTDALVNIYLGGAGSEVLFIDSLTAGWAPTVSASGLPMVYWFPVRIPRGTRISAAARTLVGGDAVAVCVELGVSNGQHWVGSGVETLGENTATSRGTAITPATTGSGWVTIGTTGRRYRHISLGVQGNNDISATQAFIQWYIGTGSAILQHCGGLRTRIDSIEAHEFQDTGRWCDIPSGTSLQLNGYSSAALSGNIFATLHGVY